MATSPVRVPEAVHGEVQTAARILGCTAAELMARAWGEYRRSPEFLADFEHAQKAFSVGDLDFVVNRLAEGSAERARTRAERVRALRQHA